MNSSLLTGDVPKAVEELKAQMEKDLVILGSGELIHSLMKHNLIDQYMLLIHPLILGSGRRMFDEHSPFTKLQLVDSKTTSTGVLIATFRPLEAISKQNEA